ncbi:transposase [Actinomadura sp. NAK00032]|uniref:transposase n=1 Tax=Actinomadura sp. NAK00032 TaxID=2742128 RepID=UPI001590F953|nr:transposase [Actinomadura sp. NAK00032]QKW33083.1 transposase [Actinomadura sp. NAK00032]
MAAQSESLKFACSPDQAKTLTAHRKGELDLGHRDATWFLLATCDVPEPDVHEPADWVGVDRGIVNLASTSDGDNHQGRVVPAALLERVVRSGVRAGRASPR